MKTIGKIALLVTFLGSLLSPFLASASTLVQSPTPNTTILDSGDVRCIGKLGTQNNKPQINISCSSSLYKTNLRITKIEIYNPVITSAEITVTAKGFPVTSAGDYVPSNKTKIYSVGVNLPASYSDSYTPMISIYPVSYFPQKIYIEGESKEFIITLAPTPIYGTSAITEFDQTEPLTLYLLGDSIPVPVVMSDSDCLSQDMHSVSSGGNSCVCVQNFMRDTNNKCVSQGDACVSLHGSKSLPVGDQTCGCAYGYFMNDKSQCVENVKPTLTPTPAPLVAPVPITPPTTPVPSITPISSPVVVSKVASPIIQPKNTGIIAKPKTTETFKSLEVRSTTTATTTTDIQGATTTIEVTPPVVEEVKIQPPQPLTPPPAPKTFWSKLISWFKFW